MKKLSVLEAEAIKRENSYRQKADKTAAEIKGAYNWLHAGVRSMFLDSEKEMRPKMSHIVEPPREYYERTQSLDIFKRTIRAKFSALGAKEKQLSKNLYKAIAHDGYKKAASHIEGGNQKGFNEESLEKLISGRKIDERVDSSVQQLYTEVCQIISRGITYADPEPVIFKNVNEAVKKSASNAEKRFYTEVSFFALQGEKLATVSSGATEYRFVARIDGKTSDGCNTNLR